MREVEVNKMVLGEPDATGRRKPETQKGSEYKISADLVIKSLGFDPENLPKLFNADELAISQWGTIKIDLNTMQTNLDGVFAAGDIVRGASLVVWAIKMEDAAIQIESIYKKKLVKKKVQKQLRMENSKNKQLFEKTHNYNQYEHDLRRWLNNISRWNKKKRCSGIRYSILVRFGTEVRLMQMENQETALEFVLKFQKLFF